MRGLADRKKECSQNQNTERTGNSTKENWHCGLGMQKYKIAKPSGI